MAESSNKNEIGEAGSVVEFFVNSPLLNEILKLEVIENQLFRANHLSKSRSSGIYGGQIICQAMASSNQTLSKEFILHSIHCYFILGGDNKKPVVYHVENVRDGRSFATRLVRAVQGSRHIFSCILSYQKHEECLHSYQISMPNVPPPDSLQLFEDVLRDILSNDRVTEHQRMFITNYISQEFLFYIKPIGKNLLNTFLDDGNEKSEQLLYWIKLRTPVDPIRQDIHRCLAGYISDLFMVQTATLKLPKSFYPSMTVSLDHSIWFHSDFHVDDWMLYESHSDRYAGGRALISGRIWKSDGTLAVSVIQEGLLRIKSLL